MQRHALRRNMEEIKRRRKRGGTEHERRSQDGKEDQFLSEDEEFRLNESSIDEEMAHPETIIAIPVSHGQIRKIMFDFC